MKCSPAALEQKKRRMKELGLPYYELPVKPHPIEKYDKLVTGICGHVKDDVDMLAQLKVQAALAVTEE